MKNLSLIFISLTSIFAMGCVITPDGTIMGVPPVATTPTLTTGVGVGTTVALDPIIHFSSRSRVTVSLPSPLIVADAYPIAQRHCARWGMHARPTYDWEISSTAVRYLDYDCVRIRPRLAFPHVIVDFSPYHNLPWYDRWYNVRRPYYSRRRVRHWPRDVYYPAPRLNTRPSRRGWLGRKRGYEDRTRVRTFPAPRVIEDGGNSGRTYNRNKNKYKRKRGWLGGRNDRVIVEPAPRVIERGGHSGRTYNRNKNKKIINERTVITRDTPYGTVKKVKKKRTVKKGKGFKWGKKKETVIETDYPPSTYRGPRKSKTIIRRDRVTKKPTFRKKSIKRNRSIIL